MANYADKTVSIIAIDDRRVLKTIRVGILSAGLEISPDGRWCYVAGVKSLEEPRGMVVVIDLLEMGVISVVKVGKVPGRVVFSHVSGEAFVNNTLDGTISRINVENHRLVSLVKVGDVSSGPNDFALSQENYPCWTANLPYRTASIIAKDHSVNVVPLQLSPGGVAVSPDGNLAFFSGPEESVMAAIKIEGSSHIVGAKYMELPGKGSGDIKGLAVTNDVRGGQVLHPESNLVSFFSVKDLTLQATITTPATPARGIITDDGAFACIVCKRGNALFVAELGSILVQ